MTGEKRTPNHCDGHQVMSFKTNLNLFVQSGQLLGILLTVSMMGWALAKSIPEMEERLSAKISPIIERVAKLEQRMDNLEVRKK